MESSSEARIALRLPVSFPLWLRALSPFARNSVGEAALDAWKLLEESFFPSDPHVQFTVEPVLMPIRTSLGSRDLVHIFKTLLSNCRRAVLEARIPNPCIQVRCAPGAPGLVTLCISDNGPGLSARDFEALTGRHDLDLALTRQLIEREKGTLGVAEKSGSLGEGAVFQLSLPSWRRKNKGEQSQ